MDENPKPELRSEDHSEPRSEPHSEPYSELGPEPRADEAEGVEKVSSVFESDIGRLADIFAEHGGGEFSDEFAANLALEVELNEVVEQVCLATGATGAAIAMPRKRQMVCRASHGETAPPLGARMDQGDMVRACLRTHQVQRCDDALTDDRVDMQTALSVGVRSVMVAPLLEGNKLLGLLEIFSSRAGAFGQREENTLEAFGGRILIGLKRVSGPAKQRRPPIGVRAEVLPELPPEPQTPALPVPEAHAEIADDALPFEATDLPGARKAWSGFDYATLALGAAVLICTVGLGALLELRMSGRKGATAARSAVGAGMSHQGIGNRHGDLQAAPAAAMGKTVDRASTGNVARSGSALSAGAGAAGGLTVYEKGKEVFRLPADAGGERGVEAAGSIEKLTDGAESGVVHRVEPEYPEAARRQGLQGAVVLAVKIGGDGVVEDVSVKSGTPLLAEAAVAAVKQWRFKPRVLNGRAAEMQTEVTLDFRLPRS